MIKENKYTYRFLARIVLEATTPLSVSSGEKNIMTDALVSTDENGLPYIPGTSLAGVLRHALNVQKDSEDAFWGYQKEKKGRGAEVIFSDAKLVGADGKVIDGYVKSIAQDAFLAHYEELPIRQHVRISAKGCAEDAGKFDEQVVFKGSRFCFDIEVVAKSEDEKRFNDVLSQLASPSFRIGGGTRKGFGEMRIVSCKKMILNLEGDGLDKYMSYSSSLASAFDGKESMPMPYEDSTKTTMYELCLKADDFFLFGSGHGDSDADMAPVKESFVVWNDKGDKGEFLEQGVLIPATSLKGAIAHRVAYIYNKKEKNYADKCDDFSSLVEQRNVAVDELFGTAGKDVEAITRGRVLINDIVENPIQENRDKLITHVSIDRFTGGAIDGALFSERSTYGAGMPYKTKIVAEDGVADDYKECLVEALKDICSGFLPLGGGTSRGNGLFTGELYENGKLIYSKK